MFTKYGCCIYANIIINQNYFNDLMSNKNKNELSKVNGNNKL